MSLTTIAIEEDGYVKVEAYVIENDNTTKKEFTIDLFEWSAELWEVSRPHVEAKRYTDANRARVEWIEKKGYRMTWGVANALYEKISALADEWKKKVLSPQKENSETPKPTDLTPSESSGSI